MGPSREACDRCQAMKTRCVREPQSQVCVRCIRLNISCNYSPPGRTGRPLGSKKARVERRQSQVDSTSPTTQTPPTSCDHDHTSMSDICPSINVGLEDFPFFESPPCSDDDSMSLFLMGNPLPEDSSFQLYTPVTVATLAESHSQSTPLSPSASKSLRSFSIAGLQQLHRALVSVGGTEILTSLQATYQPQEDLLSRLVDLQSRLAKLLKALGGGLYAPEDVEDMYRLSEELIGVLDGVNEPSRSPHAWTIAPKSEGVAVLMLSSCYFSLIHAYELLIGVFRQEIRASSSDNVRRCYYGNSLVGSPTSSQGSAPCISVGTVRLAMPRKAVAEINLHPVAQTVQHLKASMKQCASRLAADQAARGSSDSQLTNWSSVETFEEEYSTVPDLAESALHELRRREGKFFAHLRSKAF